MKREYLSFIISLLLCGFLYAQDDSLDNERIAKMVKVHGEVTVRNDINVAKFIEFSLPLRAGDIVSILPRG